jgi:predicted transcriptional regulator
MSSTVANKAESKQCPFQVATEESSQTTLAIFDPEAIKACTAIYHIPPVQEHTLSEETSLNPVELATEITIAWLNNPNNRVSADDVPVFLRSVHATVSELAAGTSAGADGEASGEEFTPAVSVRKSLGSKDHILSLIDGKPYKTLTRHLSTHGLTPDQYRERYGLKRDYPMVAETYAAHRRELAKRIGLGRKPAVASSAAPVAEVAGEAASAKPKAAPKKAATPKTPRKPRAAAPAPTE